MWTTESANPADFLRQQTQRRGIHLESLDVVQGLQEENAEIHADRGSRCGLWHPGIDDFQGLYWMQRHLCSMDRGSMPQWPVWNTEEGIVRVPLDDAFVHDDFPVLDVHPVTHEWNQPDDPQALILGGKISDVKYIGWAEVFWRVLKARIPRITKYYIGARFGVPMGWIEEIGCSPISASTEQAQLKGWL